MKTQSKAEPPIWPALAWFTVTFAGVIAPAVAIALLGEATLARSAGPILAVGLMGTGMIAAAVLGRFWAGVALAVIAGVGLLGFVLALGLPTPLYPFFILLTLVVAGVSFAARGALFAKSGGKWGWWIALFVVAGEAAIIITAWLEPGTWPFWLLALLPAQWATMAIQTAMAGSSMIVAVAPLIALAGTAATTLLVARLWPRRWTYLIMFSTWLALSALVYHQAGPAALSPDLAVSEKRHSA